FDPAKVEKIPYEDEIRALIAKLEAEKKAKEEAAAAKAAAAAPRKAAGTIAAAKTTLNSFLIKPEAYRPSRSGVKRFIGRLPREDS
ncbi:MAG: hypothetical protein IAE80_29380, partial [Anaerolinea sp.]|nr:hypothetical protein [Anaerolinea sp.]